MKFAVIKTGGKQYKIAEGGRVAVEKLPSSKDGKISFDQVLLTVNGDKVSIREVYNLIDAKSILGFQMITFSSKLNVLECFYWIFFHAIDRKLRMHALDEVLFQTLCLTVLARAFATFDQSTFEVCFGFVVCP